MINQFGFQILCQLYAHTYRGVVSVIAFYEKVIKVKADVAAFLN
jgi:hypothetical protein